MNEDLCSLTEWFRANKLSINISKTKYVLFHTRNSLPDELIPDDLTLTIDNINIDRTNCMKFLGILVDQNVLWNDHCNYITSKISKSIYILNRVKRILPHRLMKTLYYSMIYTYINYGLVLWGHTYQYNKDKLFKIQKRAIRIISNSEYNAHTDPLFTKFNILKFEEIIKLESLKMMYKVINQLLPEPIINKFTINLNIHTHNTRQASDIHITQRSKQVTHNSIVHRGPEIWSQLNNEFKIIETYNLFKYKVRQHLITIQAL